MAPTAEQIATMSGQWNKTDKTVFIRTLYERMFEVKPEWKALFKKLDFPVTDDQAAFQRQVNLTRDAFDKAVQLAANNETDQLLKTLHAMAKRHVNYNVHQQHFQELKPILVWVVEQKVPGADKPAWVETASFVLDNIVVVD